MDMANMVLLSVETCDAEIWNRKLQKLNQECGEI